MTKLAKTYKFSVGDIVKVCSEQHISQTLDAYSCLEGCSFVSQMWSYCNKEYEVIKVVSHLFDEHCQKMYNAKIPIYLLSGLICDGLVKDFKNKCDRSCYLFWHQAWLKKSEANISA